jgi:hypothetical protein
MREAESERERESQSLFQRENGKMNKKRRRRDEEKNSHFFFSTMNPLLMRPPRWACVAPPKRCPPSQGLRDRVVRCYATRRDLLSEETSGERKKLLIVNPFCSFDCSFDLFD